MGLLRASIVFIVGYLVINVLNNEHVKKVKTIPIFGDMLEPIIQTLVKKNKPLLVLIFICLIELIL